MKNVILFLEKNKKFIVTVGTAILVIVNRAIPDLPVLQADEVYGIIYLAVAFVSGASLQEAAKYLKIGVGKDG